MTWRPEYSVLAITSPETVFTLPGPPDQATAAKQLSAAQQTRYEAFLRTADRLNFLAVRTLAIRLLNLLGVPVSLADLRQECVHCGGAHGAPQLGSARGVHLSWAHTAGVVAVAVGGAPLGVDVERMGTALPPVAEAGCVPGAPVRRLDGGPPEYAWVRWVRAEALTKLTGVGIDQTLTWPLAGPAAPTGCPITVPTAGQLPSTSCTVAEVTGQDTHRDPWVVSVATPGAASLSRLPEEHFEGFDKRFGLFGVNPVPRVFDGEVNRPGK